MTARLPEYSDLGVLRGATGWCIEVVFDAYKQAGPENRHSVDNVIVTFTSKDDTADTYIEKRFAELRTEGFTNMVVATGTYRIIMLCNNIVCNGAYVIPWYILFMNLIMISVFR